MDSVKKDCEARGLTVFEAARAQDRHLWRTMLKTSECTTVSPKRKRRRREEEVCAVSNKEL